MAPGSVTSVSTTTHDDPGQYLSSSISSITSGRAQSSWLAKTYRQAAQLYLTRRLAEALDAIEPAVFPDALISGKTDSSDEDVSKSPAPVAQSSRGTRVKIWSFYLTLLNSVIELGAEEGKLAFGSTRWKSIAAKARTGSIWDEVVRYGYNGAEGRVDGEVVANLATLLLTHMPTQSMNQQRLEAYLSASMYPAFDIAAHMEASKTGRPLPQRTDTAGTSTPRDLNTRLKLLELYTLHVLPRNEEWDYAREFIRMSEVLDEERRDAFLNTLQSLQEEKNLDAIREAELKKRQEEELEKRRQDEARRRREDAEAEERAKQEKQRPARKTPAPPPTPKSTTSGSGKNTSQPRHPRPTRKPPPPTTLYQRATLVLASVQASIMQNFQTMHKNPMAALRFMLFLFAFLIAIARQDIRLRLRRGMESALAKIRQTIGMGTKVSYV